MITAVLNCSCGRVPRLVRRGDYYRYICQVCSKTGPKALTVPAAAASWNAMHQEKEPS